MSYTPEMLELIKAVEVTRSKRLNQTFPAISLEEREQILNEFHPDYIKKEMREIRVGASKGQRTPKELADVLEGRPHVDLGFDLDEPDFETELLIIGGGGAGASTAQLAQ